MSAPVECFTADVIKGLLGRESLIEIESDRAAHEIAVVLSWPDAPEFVTRRMVVSHDEARLIIAGLASVVE